MARWWGREMPSLEERVAYLEGRSEEHVTALADVRHDVRELRSETIHRFEQVDRRFDGIDRQFEHVDGRFTRVDARLDRVERRFDQWFIWVVGLQFATLLAVISAVLGAYYR